MSVYEPVAPPESAATLHEHGAHCTAPALRLPILPADISPGRLSAIVQGAGKWVNGTVLHYYFFDANPDPSWAGDNDQKDVVRASFAAWKSLGLGLNFVEVTDRHEAELRIGFKEDDGAWSYVGRDVLKVPANERTMNFDWDLTTSYGRTTALHEIGHTLGMPHEHQNPFSGIVWDEPKVLNYFRGAPNFWPDEQTRHNVLNKLSPQQVSGSEWDPKSIMEYWFPAGLITAPATHRNGITPPGTISELDKTWMVKWYPGTSKRAGRTLVPFASTPLMLRPAEQADFLLTPPQSRQYTISTFGTADTVMVLFEDVGGTLRFVAGDDDSGADRNAQLSVKLFKDRTYVLRLRMFWAAGTGQTAVMYW